MSQAQVNTLTARFAVLIICMAPSVVSSAILPQTISLIHDQAQQQGAVDNTHVPNQPSNQTRPAPLDAIRPNQKPEADASSDGSASHCMSFTHLRDLGNQSYPRFVREELCGEERCFGDVYRCRPVFYTMSVLTHRTSVGQPEDVNLPEPLRNGWRFGNIDISIGCTCAI